MALVQQTPCRTSLFSHSASAATPTTKTPPAQTTTADWNAHYVQTTKCKIQWITQNVFAKKAKLDQLWHPVKPGLIKLVQAVLLELKPKVLPQQPVFAWKGITTQPQLSAGMSPVPWFLKIQAVILTTTTDLSVLPIIFLLLESVWLVLLDPVQPTVISQLLNPVNVWPLLCKIQLLLPHCHARLVQVVNSTL